MPVMLPGLPCPKSPTLHYYSFSSTISLTSKLRNAVHLWNECTATLQKGDALASGEILQFQANDTERKVYEFHLMLLADDTTSESAGGCIKDRHNH